MNEAQRTATINWFSHMSDSEISKAIDKLVEIIELNERRISDIYENTEMDKGRKVARIQQLRRWINMRQDRLDIADMVMESREQLRAWHEAEGWIHC